MRAAARPRQQPPRPRQRPRRRVASQTASCCYPLFFKKKRVFYRKLVSCFSNFWLHRHPKETKKKKFPSFCFLPVDTPSQTSPPSSSDSQRGTERERKEGRKQKSWSIQTDSLAVETGRKRRRRRRRRRARGGEVFPVRACAVRRGEGGGGGPCNNGGGGVVLALPCLVHYQAIAGCVLLMLEVYGVLSRLWAINGRV